MRNYFSQNIQKHFNYIHLIVDPSNVLICQHNTALYRSIVSGVTGVSIAGARLNHHRNFKHSDIKTVTGNDMNTQGNHEEDE